MELDRVVSALSSPTRREMIRVLATYPMTTKQVSEQLTKKGLSLKYRESVYKGLEKLVDAGLVEKYYVREKGMCYKLARPSLKINLPDLTIE